MLTAYQAAWIFPITEPPIRHGYVTFKDDRVTEVGAKAPSGAKVIDLGNVAILPKPINAHSHLEFSDLAQPLGSPNQSFAKWISEVLTLRAARTTPKVDSIVCGISELRESQTAAIGEIATLPVSSIDYGAAPLPGICFHELLSTDLDRGITRLAEIRTLTETWPNDSPIRFGLSPHAPYTVHWELVNRSIALATEHNCPVAMHLGESMDEMELLRSHSGKMHELLVDRGVWNPNGLPRGIRLADYLHQLSKAPRSLAIHGNFFGDDEYEILARQRERMSLVICPRTCAYFLPKLPPIGELLAKGIHVALGTDSRATNPDLSIWNEVRFLFENRKDLEPSEVIRLATLSGAESLGLSRQYGRILIDVPKSNIVVADLFYAESAEEDASCAVITGFLRPLER